MAGAVCQCQERPFAPQKISGLFAVSNDHLMALRGRERAPFSTSSRHRTLQRKPSEIRANEAREKATKPSASAA
jgi:hypothetical protein